MKDITVLIIGLVWPEPQSSAAGTRILQLIQLLQDNCYNVIFASAAQKSMHSHPLQNLGIVLQDIKLNCTTFDSYIKQLQPDIVIFDRYITEEQFGWRVANNSPNSLRVLDTEDLHCLRLERQKCAQQNTVFSNLDLLNATVAKREIASIYRCDISLIISRYEMTILEQVFKIPSALLHYLPLFYTPKPTVLSIKDRRDFVFIGNFLHAPNYDALQIIKNKIWPLLRMQIPDARINIYGAYATQKVTQLHQPKDNFFVHGRAIDAYQVLENAKILLAPLRFGAGLKGKLLEAMAVGTPSITTSIGVEGISESENWSGFVAEEITELVKKAVLLYNNESIWYQKQENGYTILKDFAIENFATLFLNTLTSTINNLDLHRQNNFIGSLLAYHLVQSTRYLSKYIAIKNASISK